MTPPLELFDLLWSAPETRKAVAAGLSGQRWKQIDVAAGQHRLRPLLRARLAESAALRFVPDIIVRRWDQLHTRASLLAFRQRAELARMVRLLGREGIDTTVLKGGGLVWRGWIEPALRPMRDLDVLVDEADALSAHAILRQQGYQGEPAQSLTDQKHLPGLLSADTRVLVEIHTRLVAPYAPGWAEREADFRQRVLRRTGPVAASGDLPRGLAPTDALLHLIMHGTLDHQFNNGPQLLADIELLTAHGDIDWSCFWKEAEALAVTRACSLALTLAAQYARVSGIGWDCHRRDRQDMPPPPDLLAAAAAMLLIDTGRKSELGWAGQIVASARGQRLSRIGAMIARRQAAASSAGPRDRRGTLMALLRVAGRYAATLATPSARRHIRHSLKVARWLRGD